MLHKNVIDYLKTGGKVVEDFVDRCMQLLADTTETETDVSSVNLHINSDNLFHIILATLSV
jgi:hypothetical protein